MASAERNAPKGDLSRYQAHLRVTDHDLATIRRYCRHLKTFMTWMADRPWTTESIEEYKSVLAERYAQRTVAQGLHAIRSYCGWLIGEGVLHSDPTAAVSIPLVRRLASGSPSPLSESDLDALRQAFHAGNNLRDIALLEVLLNAGIRSGQLLGLERDVDVDIEGDGRNGGTIYAKENRGRRRRPITLNKSAAMALARWLAYAPRTADRRVFPLTAAGLLCVIDRYAGRAGLARKVQTAMLRRPLSARLTTETDSAAVDISDLVRYGTERTWLDFKMTQYGKDKHEDLLKDIMAMANADVEGNRYLVIGVELLRSGDRIYHDIAPQDYVDAANYQQLVYENIEPRIRLKYEPLRVDGHSLGIITIGPCDDPPYCMKKEYRHLTAGEWWVRQDTSQHRGARADFDRLRERYRR